MVRCDRAVDSSIGCKLTNGWLSATPTEFASDPVWTKIAFGHGHPVTSGSPGIDYFVSSELFETAASIDGREARRIDGTASDISAATGAEAVGDDEEDGANHSASATYARPTPSEGTFDQTDTAASNHDRFHPRGKLSRVRTQSILPEERSHDNGSKQRQGLGGDGGQDYTEQLVLFDSLTASLPEVVGATHAPSSAVAAVLEAVRASSPTSATLHLLQEGDHLYHCIQHSKKFHPDFDPVLRGVLQSDPAAKILLSAANEVSVYPTTRYGLRSVVLIQTLPAREGASPFSVTSPSTAWRRYLWFCRGF